MASPGSVEARYTVERYFALVDEGLLHPEDRVELLEGVVVAMSPQNPAHASAITWVLEALGKAIGERAVIRVQLPFIAGAHSVPEPDLAVVPGRKSDYNAAHPTRALLIVEVAESSLLQDRLTKGPMYAAADVPEYWIVCIPHDRIEIFRSPDPEARRYTESRIARRGERIELTAAPGATVAVDDLLPSG